MKPFLFFLFAFAQLVLSAQENFPINGVHNDKEGCYAFTGATIVVSADKALENATLIIRKGKIEEVGTDLSIPKDAIVTDLKGKFIYPSFIDIYSNYGLPEPKAVGKATDQRPQQISNKDGAYGWNEALRPEYKAATEFAVDEKTSKALREAGFGAVLTHKFDGIARGTGAFVLTGTERENMMLLRETASNHFSFKKGTSNQDYPSSLMGAIALLRQTYLDADWYAKKGYLKETDLSLAAWNLVNLKSIPQFFEVSDKLEALRADKIGDEFGVSYIIKGKGDEYQRIEEIKATGNVFILPLNFPKPYDIEDPFDAEIVAFSDLKHWELAPTNPARLKAAGIKFAFTANGLENKSDFVKQMRIAVKNGLSKQEAIKAATSTPAELVGMQNEVGTLEKGKIANFLITSDDIFEKDDAVIFQHWVNGIKLDLKSMTKLDLRGNYQVKVGEKSFNFFVGGTVEKPTMKTAKDSSATEIKYTINENNISLFFSLSKEAKDKIYRLSGTIEGDKWLGRAQTPEGDWVKWEALKTENFQEKKKDDPKKDESANVLGDMIFPFAAYGRKEIPTAKTYLISNATVWTNEKDGILQNTDVLIENGKIQAVGKGLNAGSAIVIDGTGKHLTAGIVDEHSHIALSKGVNEGTQASSAEVRIGDVVNCDDVNIYRNLAGGVVAIQQLHGSANPIGGQSCLTKLRWGYAPEKMKIEGADGFIKFALGENVKQSNWGDNARTRFPQTRMGVEQIYESYFTRAEEYMKDKSADKRKDLEMETLAEILTKKRFITCHSYVQSEINMLMKVATKHNFNVNTFTHILEGYKVADKMAKHGVGGSTFADWWAYKMEVKDAIPYNAYILHQLGVVTAINSDDAEMSRRLNQEAAKVVKYGGISEEEAWKMVTLNPAKLLHLDNQMGSVKKGKSADVVLWSDNPLSVYAKAEKTFVDGILFFDKDEDLKLRAYMKSERSRLIQKMIAAKAQGGGSQGAPKVEESDEHHHQCDDVRDWLKQED